jgi:integrase
MTKDQSSKDHLQRRGDQYYVRLAIPRPLRQFFLSRSGRPMDQIQQPLGDSKEVAIIECARRVANFRELFARLQAGEKMTPNQIKAALRGPDEGSMINEALRRWHAERPNPWEDYARLGPIMAEVFGTVEEPAQIGYDPAPAANAAPARYSGETISQAAAAWFPEFERTKPRASTLKDRQNHVQALIDAVGDLPLTAIDRQKAADFLDGLKVSTLRRNTYANTLKRVFKTAIRRGFRGENPFDGQRLRVTKGEKKQRDRFTIEEVQTLVGAFPPDINPKKYTPETAVPWVVLLAAHTGMCLEEICQLTLADIREETVNGGTLVCIDIHNGDEGHLLKNEDARPRLLPIPRALVEAGFLTYVDNVRKQGHKQLFPGLTRRPSKDNKIGPRVGELFNKKRKALGIVRNGKKLDFHSFRHTVANTLERAGVSQTDAARVLGHTIEGQTFGNYSEGGPGLIRVRDVIDQITYEGLRP